MKFSITEFSTSMHAHSDSFPNVILNAIVKTEKTYPAPLDDIAESLFCIGCDDIQHPLTKVSQGTCWATCASITIFDTSHMQQFLGHRRTHDTGPTGCRDQPHQDTPTLSCHLMREPKIRIVTLLL